MLAPTPSVRQPLFETSDNSKSPVGSLRVVERKRERERERREIERERERDNENELRTRVQNLLFTRFLPQHDVPPCLPPLITVLFAPVLKLGLCVFSLSSLWRFFVGRLARGLST